MPHIPKRWDGENQWYFVTTVTRNREPLFVNEEYCQELLAAFKEVYHYHPFRLAGLTIMTDHWHGVIHPYSPKVIETVVGAVKENMLRRIWKTEKRSSIWQDRFLDHRIRNQEDFAFHIEYIRLNAIKHEVAKSPESYPWCFIHENPFKMLNH